MLLPVQSGGVEHIAPSLLVATKHSGETINAPVLRRLTRASISACAVIGGQEWRAVSTAGAAASGAMCEWLGGHACGQNQYGIARMRDGVWRRAAARLSFAEAEARTNYSRGQNECEPGIKPGSHCRESGGYCFWLVAAWLGAMLMVAMVCFR
jgi:hypothetical protein